MSFYLDDYPDDDHQGSSQICPNCSGTSFYNDPITGTLTCESCYTQSQTATQEELDYDEGIGLAATGAGKRTHVNKRKGRVGGCGRKGRVGRPLTEYDRSQKLPDAESCCLAFQWLLRDASKCVSKLAGIQEDEQQSNINTNGYYSDEQSEGEQTPSIMERTVKKIWFTYLQAWMEATKEYSAKYPEMRVSFRDYFLEDTQKSQLMRHLNVTIGKKVETELLDELEQRPHHEGQDDDEFSDAAEDERSLSSVESGITNFTYGTEGNDNAAASISTPSRKVPDTNKRKRPQILTIAHLSKRMKTRNPRRYPNGIYDMHPHHAAIKVQPSLTLLLSILQLALTHLQTGVAPHHLTMWVANGQLPHALNGYALLPKKLKERVGMVKNFFMRSFVPPASTIANMTDMLATACGWYSDGKMAESNVVEAGVGTTLANIGVFHSSEMAKQLSPIRSSAADSITSEKPQVDTALCHQKSLYNVPLLAARMVQDLGFDQQVLDNVMSLMGVVNNSSSKLGGVKEENQDDDNESDDRAGSISGVDTAKKNQAISDHHPPPLTCVSAAKLYTTLHIAAVIVVACKFCPHWETWKITNLHSKSSQSNAADAKSQPQQVFVPWNESQFQLLGNGQSVNNYLNFLESAAFNGIDAPAGVSQFFQSLLRDSNTQSSKEKDNMMSSATKPTVTQNKARVTPNIILSGAPNPNEPSNSSDIDSSKSSSHDEHKKVNNMGRYTFYQYTIHNNKKVLGIKPYHPHYCRLLEYICYIIEETNTGKLHDMVHVIEEELLSHISDDKEGTRKRISSTKSKKKK